MVILDGPVKSPGALRGAVRRGNLVFHVETGFKPVSTGRDCFPPRFARGFDSLVRNDNPYLYKTINIVQQQARTPSETALFQRKYQRLSVKFHKGTAHSDSRLLHADVLCRKIFSH